jgi:hypothetical protein
MTTTMRLRWAARTLIAVGVFIALPAAAQKAPPAPAPAAPPAATPVASSAAPAPPDTTVPPGTSEVPANIRLRNLEQRVEALKEQTWRVKARVGMLKEAVLGGGIGARATIVHQNKMGGSFRLTRVIYAMDGQQIFARIDEDSSKLNDLKDIEILSGPIAPGNHTISVLLEYRGQGYGVFSYLKEYKFTVKSSHTFTATEGKETQISVIGYEKGGITTQLKDRPAVEFKESVNTDHADTTAAPAK